MDECARCHTSYNGEAEWIKSPTTGRVICDMCLLVLVLYKNGGVESK